MANLGRVCEAITGTTPPKNNIENYGRDVPFVKPPQLKDKPINDAPEKLSIQGAKFARVLPSNSVLVTCIGNLGRTAINRIPVAFNQQINALIPSEILISSFLFYQAQSPNFKKQLEGLASATTVTIVNKGKFETIQISISPLPEQHRIVAKIEELFSELDKGVEALKTAQQQLKVYRQAVLQRAFEGKLTEEWRAQQKELPTAAQLLEQIKAEREKQGKTIGKKFKPVPPITETELTELPTLPDGWCWVRLSYVGQIETGTTPQKSNSEFYGNDYPFFKPTDLDAGYNVRKAYDNLSVLGIQQARFLPEDSVLVTCIGATIGKTGVIRSRGASNQQINAVIPFTPLNHNYLYFQIIGHFFQKQILVNASATTLPILNKSKFEVLLIVICTYNEQIQIVQEIEARLSVADKVEETISQSLQQAEALRQSILKKAFAGKLVPQDPNDEPASKPLERIKAEKAAQATVKGTVSGRGKLI